VEVEGCCCEVSTELQLLCATTAQAEVGTKKQTAIVFRIPPFLLAMTGKTDYLAAGNYAVRNAEDRFSRGQE